MNKNLVWVSQTQLETQCHWLDAHDTPISIPEVFFQKGYPYPTIGDGNIFYKDGKVVQTQVFLLKKFMLLFLIIITFS